MVLGRRFFGALLKGKSVWIFCSLFFTASASNERFGMITVSEIGSTGGAKDPIE
jgi:hypothetical protein